jgi:hypothetical protein
VLPQRVEAVREQLAAAVRDDDEVEGRVGAGAAVSVRRGQSSSAMRDASRLKTQTATTHVPT